MEHAEAVKIQAVERYFLHELSSSELQAFEEHFFICADCAADMESCSSFIANAREVFKDEPSGPKNSVSASPWWLFMTGLWAKPWAWTPSLAAFALGFVALYQGLILMPELAQKAEVGNEARSLPTFQLTGRSRGEVRAVVVSRKTPFFGVSFDINPEADFSAFRCDLRDSSGRVQFTVPTAPPPAGQQVTILVPTHGLQPGIYNLVLFGISEIRGGGTRIADYAFRLDLK